MRKLLIALAVLLPVVAVLFFLAYGSTDFSVGGGPGRDKPLPVFWEAPAFTLIDQDSTQFSSSELDGHIWLVSFVYTKCPDVCPLITERMAKLRAEFAASTATRGQVRLLSISVDPVRDQPTVLREYARRFKATQPDWVFITGPVELVVSLINQGFRLSTIHPRVHDANEPAHKHDSIAGDYVVAHSDRIVLIDRKRQVRGTYQSSDPASLAQLRADVARLVKE
jgi:cytochrome oxidase Cu insertion factor (SCO1/SenC/PrrC family)